MSQNAKKNASIMISVVLSMVTLILVAVLKRNLEKVPFIKKLFNLGNLGMNSIKDFLEVSELNLRADVDFEYSVDQSNGNKKEKGTRLTWVNDGSDSYTIYLASTYISKLRILNAPAIKDFDPSEIEKLHKSHSWIRKIHIQVDKVDTDKTGVLEKSFVIPMSTFNCRVQSSNGRMSKNLSFSAKDGLENGKSEIKTWLSKHDGKYYVNIEEPDNKYANRVLEYRIRLYIRDGLGLTKTVPPFKGTTKFKLGRVPPSLCYLTGNRNMGQPFEQYVGWIDEDRSLNVDDELSRYLDN
jgi:hypothetical protein